jgi:hypothetical protein
VNSLRFISRSSAVGVRERRPSVPALFRDSPDPDSATANICQMSAIDVFRQLDSGVLDLIRAADLYTILLLAHHNKTSPDPQMIENILGAKHVSGYAIAGEYYSPSELAMLETTGGLRRVGEQVILATYTAIEVYLEDKFREYAAYLARSINPAMLDALTSKVRFRSLDDFKTSYFQVLGIHLPSFDCTYFVDIVSHFQPRQSWDALTLLSEARNQIAHTGKSSSYQIKTLLDAWYPFEFARMWVNMFDVNFDLLLYQGQVTRTIGEYRERLHAAGLPDRFDASHSLA